MDGNYEYSYSDGDQWYQWSPDSKWILTNYIGIGGWNNKDVALVNASGNGEIHNLTESGYSDGNAKWVLDGKAMIGKVTAQDSAATEAGALKRISTSCSSTWTHTTVSE